MAARKSLWTVAIATVLLAAVPAVVMAFGIRPPQPGAHTQYDFAEWYTDGPGVGVVWLDPAGVTSIARGGTAAFNARLAASYPAWNFVPAGADLNGFFDVDIYDAKDTNHLGGPAVGAEIYLRYTLGAGDPQPNPALGGSCHWIQRVRDNHNITDNPGHGNLEDVIDVGGALPYYDQVGDAGWNAAAGTFYFHDWPSRPDRRRYHWWDAELYLVDETAAQAATIYNGVSWGWRNVWMCPNILAGPALGVLAGLTFGFNGVTNELEFSSGVVDRVNLDASGWDYGDNLIGDPVMGASFDITEMELIDRWDDTFVFGGGALSVHSGADEYFRGDEFYVMANDAWTATWGYNMIGIYGDPWFDDTGTSTVIDAYGDYEFLTGWEPQFFGLTDTSFSDWFDAGASGDLGVMVSTGNCTGDDSPEAAVALLLLFSAPVLCCLRGRRRAA